MFGKILCHNIDYKYLMKEHYLSSISWYSYLIYVNSKHCSYVLGFFVFFCHLKLRYFIQIASVIYAVNGEWILVIYLYLIQYHLCLKKCTLTPNLCFLLVEWSFKKFYKSSGFFKYCKVSNLLESERWENNYLSYIKYHEFRKTNVYMMSCLSIKFTLQIYTYVVFNMQYILHVLQQKYSVLLNHFKHMKEISSYYYIYIIHLHYIICLTSFYQFFFHSIKF